jgi:group II intron reverse transcriptase/maturase
MSRGDHVPPGSAGKRRAGQRGTGTLILSKARYAKMQDATTVLSIIRQRGERGLPVKRLYRHLFNPQFYFQAYARLYSNDGAMTPDATGETVDGMSREKIKTMIDLIRQERWRWTPVKRVYIPKKSGKLRPLGLPSWSSKVMQEVVRQLLDAYFEPTFSDRSHGFRPGRGPHTALSEIVHGWKGVHWIIEGDISDCFGRLDHEVLLNILGERIHDNRFLRLIRHMLQAGYLEEWRWHETLSGAPQGGVCSPILSNIYLDKRDKFVETVLLPKYNRELRRRKNPAYQQIEHAIARAKRRGDRQTVRTLRKQRRKLPSQDPQDPSYRRLRYVRYADDWALGFSGPKAEAEEIKREIRDFLRETLKLELSEEKTLVTHIRTCAAKFLGYEIVSQHVDDKLDRRGQRQVNETIGLRVPKAVIEQKCAMYMQRGKPAQRAPLIRESDYSILSKYQAEYRGIVQYYLLAHNVAWFGKLYWVAETSLLKTLAGKHRSTVTKMAKRHKATIETADGPKKCLQVIVQRGEHKKALVARFGGIPLKRKPEAILVDRLPQFVMTNRSELLQRVLADTCELCGSKEQVEVHHIRKLADLQEPGRREKPVWVKQMAARRRKTLVVCRKCHEDIHAGTSTASFRKQGLESRMTRKRSSPVREEDNGKGP